MFSLTLVHCEVVFIFVNEVGNVLKHGLVIVASHKKRLQFYFQNLNSFLFSFPFQTKKPSTMVHGSVTYGLVRAIVLLQKELDAMHSGTTLAISLYL